MNKFAVMPLEDYSKACDKIREINQTDQPIKSGEMPEKIADVFNSGKIALLKDSEYMNADVSDSVVVINDVSPIANNLDVIVKAGADNLLPSSYYSIAYTPSGNIKYTENNNSISMSGTEASAIDPLPLYIMLSNLVHGTTYYCGIKYVGEGNADKYPLSISFSVSSSSGDQNGTNIVWDSSAYMFLLIVTPELNKNYNDCEFIPVISTTPITDEEIDVTTVSVSRYGKNLISEGALISQGWAKQSDGTLSAKGSTVLNKVIYQGNGQPRATTFSYRYKMSTSSYYGPYVEIQYTDGTVYSKKPSKSTSLLFYYITSDPSKVIDKIIWTCDLSNSNSQTVTATIREVQLEFNSAKTTYEPYVEPQIEYADAEGNIDGIETLPNMTLIPSNKNVILNCKYLRDIDTYIDNLMMNVALTGGE